MKKQTILENVERYEISRFLKILSESIKYKAVAVCNTTLLNRYIEDLDRDG